MSTQKTASRISREERLERIPFVVGKVARVCFARHDAERIRRAATFSDGLFARAGKGSGTVVGARDFFGARVIRAPTEPLLAGVADPRGVPFAKGQTPGPSER